MTFKGDVHWPAYEVLFRDIAGHTTKVDDETLRVITPAHLPGPAPITIFEYDVHLGTELTLTFVGEAEDVFEPVLLPVFTQPIAEAAHIPYVRCARCRNTPATVPS